MVADIEVPYLLTNTRIESLESESLILSGKYLLVHWENFVSENLKNVETLNLKSTSNLSHPGPLQRFAPGDLTLWERICSASSRCLEIYLNICVYNYMILYILYIIYIWIYMFINHIYILYYMHYVWFLYYIYNVYILHIKYIYIYKCIKYANLLTYIHIYISTYIYIYIYI